MSEIILDATKVPEKGQIVIPKDIRDFVSLKTGSKLIIIASHDTLILQKVEVFGERVRVRDILGRAKSIAERLGLIRR